MKYLSLETRKELYKQIEKIRNKNLITYVTSIRPGMSGQMAGDAVDIILKQLDVIPKECKEIDFLIISNGGDPITSLRIISLLRERFDKVTVLVPYVAYSAATILALGADEIIMHPYSNLGPTDPQITTSKVNPNGQRENLCFGSEDIRNYIDFVKEDVGIRKKDLVNILANISKDVSTLTIGSTKRSQRLSYALSMKLLRTHMKSRFKMNKIAKTLSQSYYHHSYALGRTEVKKLGLNVINPDEKLENLLWKVWEDFALEMKVNKSFDILGEIMDDPIAKEQLENIPVLNYPANIPLELVRQKMVQLIQQSGVTLQKCLETDCLMASIESTRRNYHITNNIKIAYWRDLSMKINTNITVSSKGWVEK